MTRGLLPDRTFLLLLRPDESAARLGERPDRIEREGGEFRARVDAAYRELAELFPRRVFTLDATLPPEELAEIVRGSVRHLS